ncbi:MAG: hypothetical protein GW748_07580 [Alphaproteobacteria bacterium]|nr:hypothetical protein [Alphaproteobacteria bacterium]NCQ67587.1 hypothetical protein [Alphaproteobacteria bacterium]NCT08359.1 hypothetical protein [Alphaproteobacteria bacterium]
MKIKKIAFGNKASSFIEDRIKDGVNVIFSDDNNRGKTLVIQGMMYSLGNDPIFPSGFNYKDQYFYSKIEKEGEQYEFLRKNNYFVFRTTGMMKLFDSARDFRHFFDKNLFKLPRIAKDNRLRMVGLSLFYELFFIGQDHRSTSNVISKGEFNKSDFKSMVFALGNIHPQIDSEKGIEPLKEKIKSLKQRQNSVNKKMSLIKANPNIADIAYKYIDNEIFQKKKKKISEINKRISEIQKERNRETNRMEKLRTLISELKSLNRELDEGRVKCGECGSEKITYSNKDFTFDISNAKVRGNILESIDREILQKQENIDDYIVEINKEQDSLKDVLETTPVHFQDVIAYQENILSDRSLDDESVAILKEISALEAELNLKKTLVGEGKTEQKEFLESILKEMSRVCRVIDPNGALAFNDLFTNKDITFSGSEEQEYYFCRLIALNNILQHDFPIIIDSFRDGEVSTQKEHKMLEVYQSLGKQVILTSTLKKEEYNSLKYKSFKNINALDYSSHINCGIMQSNKSKEFMDIISSFEGMII